MNSEALDITAETKVADLIEHYPELEDLLIGMAPPFKKLKNPILRRSVAKVASLRQAAAVGRLQVETMVNDLRAAIGQKPICIDARGNDQSYFTAKPAWFDKDMVVASLEETEIDPNTMPLKPLIQRANKLAPGEIVELVTGYLPAPGIDLMKNKGYLVWSTEEDGITKTYFARQGPAE